MYRMSRHGVLTGLYSLTALLVLGVACAGQPPATSAPPATAMPAATTVTLNLAAQNSSGQAGTATLTAKGAQTEVVLALSLGPAGAAVEQPVHIHSGSCATLGGVVYPLANLVAGKSTTTVNATLDSLRTGNFAINAHKSGQEVSVYTSCGAIPAKAG
jgi:hypothetical protein